MSLYNDPADATVRQLGQLLDRALAEHDVDISSSAPAVRAWAAFAWFAKQAVTHRGAPIEHDVVLIEGADRTIDLSRLTTVEDEAGEQEGELRTVLTLTFHDESIELDPAEFWGPAGTTGAYGEGDDNELPTLDALADAVFASTLGQPLRDGTCRLESAVGIE